MTTGQTQSDSEDDATRWQKTVRIPEVAAGLLLSSMLHLESDQNVELEWRFSASHSKQVRYSSIIIKCLISLMDYTKCLPGNFKCKSSISKPMSHKSSVALYPCISPSNTSSFRLDMLYFLPPLLAPYSKNNHGQVWGKGVWEGGQKLMESLQLRDRGEKQKRGTWFCGWMNEWQTSRGGKGEKGEPRMLDLLPYNGYSLDKKEQKG